MFTIGLIIKLIILFLTSKKFTKAKTFYGRKASPPSAGFRNNKKLEWVINELIKLKALMPNAGCRLIAHSFNRRFACGKKMTVSKTYVSYTLKNHQYEIKITKRKLKLKRPYQSALNKIWAIDLTFLSDSQNNQLPILGTIEHQSRLSFSLAQLQSKASINIIKILILAIEQFGKPRNIRTDNEIVFTSRLFRFSLWLLGIKHQKTDKGCPWQNGRIERFFGTVKSKLKLLPIGNQYPITTLLKEYRAWYNYLRPHDYLDGRTPIEVFTGKYKSLRKPKLISFWDGVLVGDYYPP